MPIITIHAKAPISKILNVEIQEAAAKAMEDSPENFWVSSVELDADWSHPPYITVLAKRGRTEKTKRRFVEAVAEAAAKRLGTKPENIWIHYQELNLNEVWFYGRWASRKWVS